MNKSIAFTTGLIIPIFGWLSGKMLYDKAIEPWDADVTFYLSQFFPVILAFAFALRWRFVSALLFLAGLFVGNILYPMLFGHTDQKSMWIQGAMISSMMFVYPLIAAILGWVLRGTWVHFFAARFNTLNATLNHKVDVFFQKPPKWAYRPINFTQSAASGALKTMIIALFFGALGILLVIYPSPPLEPLPPYIKKITHIVGYLLAGGFFWYGYRALQLYLHKGQWRITLDDEKLIYHTPKGSAQPSFECRLDEIDKVKIINIQSNVPESSAPPLYYLYTKSGERYEFGYDESRFAPHRLVEALRARGIGVDYKYE